MKKCFAILLSVLLVLCLMLPFAALAADADPETCPHEHVIDVPAVEGTCTHSGKTAGTKCADCGTILSGVEDTGLVPTNHANYKTEVRDAVDATCAHEGYSGDVYCLACGEPISMGTTIPKSTTHTGQVEVRGKVDATCTDAGYSGDKYCGECNALLVTGHVTPINEKHHGDYELEVRDAKEPTCGEHGYSGDTYCTGCGHLVTQGCDLLPTGEHVDADGDKICDNCGKAIPEPGSEKKSFGDIVKAFFKPANFFRTLWGTIKAFFSALFG